MHVYVKSEDSHQTSRKHKFVQVFPFGLSGHFCMLIGAEYGPHSQMDFFYNHVEFQKLTS